MKRVEVIFKLHKKQTLHVVRGGTWYDYPGLVRVAYRRRFSPDLRNYDGGFRLVQEK